MQVLGLAGAWQKSRVVRLRRFLEGRLGLTPNQIRRWARAILPKRVAARLDSRFREAQLQAGAKDVAYSVAMHSDVGGVYINRQRFSDEDAFLEFRQRIATDIERLTDPSTKLPFVKAVQVRGDVYSGSALDECPDVIFHLAPEYGLSGGVGPRGQLISARRQDLNKQGVHRDKGIFLLRGPGAREGTDGPQQSLLDITATILYLLDVPVPSKMDSRPIQQALTEEFVAAHPVRHADVPRDSVEKTSEAEGMTSEDQEALMERLRGLGYVE